MKKMMSMMALAATAVTLALGGVACDDQEGSITKAAARDIYATSLVSSVAYLSGGEGGEAAPASVMSGGAIAAPMSATNGQTATARPDTVTEGNVNDIQGCIASFEEIIAGGGVEQTVKTNTSADPRLSGYALEMTISFHNALGGASYAMYFNETSTSTEIEKEGFTEEIEVSTTFEGVALVGEELFVLQGEKEVETEGKEQELSIEFRTYKNLSVDGVEADRRNYVEVSYSVETDEVEYEYTFVADGRKVRDLEVEFEEDRHGVEISFQFKDVSTGALEKTFFTVKKGTGKDVFVVKLNFSGDKKETILVSLLESGEYQFKYDNGFVETVG